MCNISVTDKEFPDHDFGDGVMFVFHAGLGAPSRSALLSQD